MKYAVTICAAEYYDFEVDAATPKDAEEAAWEGYESGASPTCTECDVSEVRELEEDEYNY